MIDSPFTIVEPSFQTQERTRAYYRWRADGYDKVTSYEIEHHREAIQLANIRPDERILEVACGTGRATMELAALLEERGRIEALDLSPTMLKHAQRKAGEQGLLDRVVFRTGCAQVLPYTSSAFDVLYNSYMFDLVAVSQFEVILKEFARVLKPGGRLILVNMSKNKPAKTFYERVYETVRLFPCRPVVMADFVEQAGFVDVRRIYRCSFSGSIRLPFGTEIVTAKKAERSYSMPREDQ